MKVRVLSYIFYKHKSTLDSPLVRVVHVQRYWTHLDSVSIISRILKQTVIWIEHLTRQKEKELPRWSAIIQTETAKQSYVTKRLFDRVVFEQRPLQN